MAENEKLIGGLTPKEVEHYRNRCEVLKRYAPRSGDRAKFCHAQCKHQIRENVRAACPQGLEDTAYTQVVPRGWVPDNIEGDIIVFDASKAQELPPRDGVKIADAGMMGANHVGGERFVGEFFGITIEPQEIAE